ncbi:MAG: methyl-accepting chemotaxis protein [Maritimibacter sp.]
MNTRTKIFAVFGIAIVLAWGTLGGAAYGLWTLSGEAAESADQIDRVSSQNVPLLTAIKDLKLDVVQVQQWLTDISATRGLPGFDDGFDEAAGYAERFNGDVTAALGYANDLQLTEITQALEKVQTAFPPFYAGGQDMAHAYIDTGPEGGNPQMEIFDTAAENMGIAMENLLTIVSEQTDMTMTEMVSLGQTTAATAKNTIWILGLVTAFAALFTLGALAQLFIALRRDFLGLDGDLALVTSGDESTEFFLKPERPDEFGNIARALMAFRTAQIEARAHEAQMREAQQKEDKLKREAETLRIEQAEAEARAMEEEAAAQEEQRKLEEQIIEEISQVVAACANGDFSQVLSVDDKQGIYAELCRQINRIGHVTNDGLSAVQAALELVAEGELGHRMQDDLPGVFGKISETMNQTVATLTDTLQHISISSHSVDGATREISHATDDLARRSEKAAASLAQTAEAVAEMSHSLAEVTKSTDIAGHSVEDITERTDAGQDVLSRAVSAMDEIRKSSEGISKILQVIEEISFQTNLLALNAGVEAARAGEAGRGFAVVASEVRALAQRSADASREISDLIQTSDDNVKRGVELVQQSGHALDGISEGVGDVATKIREIAVSTRESAQRVSEISKATSHVDETTQQNAAMFEETNAAVRALEGEASALAEAVSTFRFDANTDAAPSESWHEAARSVA